MHHSFFIIAMLVVSTGCSESGSTAHDQRLAEAESVPPGDERGTRASGSYRCSFDIGQTHCTAGYFLYSGTLGRDATIQQTDGVVVLQLANAFDEVDRLQGGLDTTGRLELGGVSRADVDAALLLRGTFADDATGIFDYFVENPSNPRDLSCLVTGTFTCTRR